MISRWQSGIYPKTKALLPESLVPLGASSPTILLEEEWRYRCLSAQAACGFGLGYDRDAPE